MGGLVGGPNTSSAATTLSKFVKHPIKNLVSDFSEAILLDFTNWYSRLVIENSLKSCAKAE